MLHLPKTGTLCAKAVLPDAPTFVSPLIFLKKLEKIWFFSCHAAQPHFFSGSPHSQPAQILSWAVTSHPPPPGLTHTFDGQQKPLHTTEKFKQSP